MLQIEPFASDRDGDVRLVLVIGGDDLNRFAQDLIIEILRGELRRSHGSGTTEILASAVVTEHADLYDAVGYPAPVRLSKAIQGRHRRNDGKRHPERASAHPHLCLILPCVHLMDIMSTLLDGQGSAVNRNECPLHGHW